MGASSASPRSSFRVSDHTHVWAENYDRDMRDALGWKARSPGILHHRWAYRFRGARSKKPLNPHVRIPEAILEQQGRPGRRALARRPGMMLPWNSSR